MQAGSESDSDSDDGFVSARGKIGRAEKKARKAMQKLGMKVRAHLSYVPRPRLRPPTHPTSRPF